MARRKNELGATLSNIVASVRALLELFRSLSHKIDPFGPKKRRLDLRLSYFRKKYTDEALAWRITRGEYWPGQTTEQLRDSLGPPAAVDNILLKTMKREVWKYYRSGVNRYRLRITLDNDKVASWDQKG